jgi:ABC-type bacteriocin/lantibiotic exporter with double-glycine peptidase domain
LLIRKSWIKLKKKLDGQIPFSENGYNLSSDQRQRLVLERVMLQTPHMIIFDRATSVLNNISAEVALSRKILKEFTTIKPV